MNGTNDKLVDCAGNVALWWSTNTQRKEEMQAMDPEYRIPNLKTLEAEAFHRWRETNQGVRDSIFLWNGH